MHAFIAKRNASGKFAAVQQKWSGHSFPQLTVTVEPEFAALCRSG